MDESDDPRDIELSSLSAIFPEIRRVRHDDPYIVALDVPVKPSRTVVVRFPTPPDASRPAPEGGGPSSSREPVTAGVPANPTGTVDTHELAHLPSVQLRVSLGPGYPATAPPLVTISTSPPWLPAETIKKLEDDGPRLWEEMGRDMVAFTYIDHVQQSADDVFGLAGSNGDAALEVDPRHKIALLDYDISAKRAAFEKETFDCGVCLDPKKGSACHRMLDCGHVFCVGCLQDFYNSAIKEGDIASVRCLEPNCARNREKAAAAASSSKKGRKAKTTISPSELLQIPLSQEVVKRYVTLKYKNELESDKNTIYCPRSWCHGAARSKRRRKPNGLDLDEEPDAPGSGSGSDSDSDDTAPENEDGAGELKSKPYKPLRELLAVCEDCGFAFCRRCFASWHGEFVRCTPRRDQEELTAEELASLEYVRLHTSPCPTCAAPAQKTHGCNHMICYRCQSHFCYLCSAWLDPGNPYQHFNEMPGGKRTACYMRLWELEDGDAGDEADYGFAGGPALRRGGGGGPVAVGAGAGAAGAVAAAVQPAVELVPEIEEAEDDEETEAARRAAQEERRRQNAQQGGGQVAFAREGPLVLRIAGHHHQPVEPPPPPPPPPPPQPLARRAGHHRGPGPGPDGGRRGGANNTNAAPRGPQQQQHRNRDRPAAARGGRGTGRGARRGAVMAGAGIGRGGAAAAAAARRQNNNFEGPAGQHQQQHQARNPQRRVDDAAPARAAIRIQPMPADGDGDNVRHRGGGAGDLDAAQRAWVRQFVQLALNDQEDILLEPDSDSDLDL